MFVVEDADEKPGGQRRHWQRDPKPNGQAQVHCDAGGEKPAERRHQLPEAPCQCRRPESPSPGEDLVNLRHYRIRRRWR